MTNKSKIGCIYQDLKTSSQPAAVIYKSCFIVYNINLFTVHFLIISTRHFKAFLIVFHWLTIVQLHGWVLSCTYTVRVVNSSRMSWKCPHHRTCRHNNFKWIKSSQYFLWSRHKNKTIINSEITNTAAMPYAYDYIKFCEKK